MRESSKPLDVRQDLRLRGPATAFTALHGALTARAAHPWRFDAQKTERFRTLGREEGALAFERAATPGFEAVGLVLTATDDGMRVANIAPLLKVHLTVGEYNAILEDFAACIAWPAAQVTGCRVEFSCRVVP